MNPSPQPFGELLLEPLRNGITCPARQRGTGVPLINMREIFAFDRIGDVEAELAPLSDDRRPRFLLESGDLLFARQSLKIEGAGKVSLVLPSAHERTWEGHLIRARLDRTKADPGFYYYFFRSKRGRSLMHTIVEQVGAAGIRGSDLVRLPVPVPPLQRQSAIADVLGALDDKIDANRHVAHGAEALAATEVAVAADDAEWVELGEIAEHHKTSVNPATIDGDVDHFSIPAFDAGQLPVREPGAAIKSNKLSVPDRSVLVSRLNPRIPRVWFARTTEGVPSVCSTEFLVLRPKGDLTEGELFAACSHPTVLADMTLRAGGTSGSHQRIKPADALSVAVPNPGSELLRATLTPLLETAAHARVESATLTELRDALLPKLLSGELRVGDIEGELEEAGV